MKQEHPIDERTALPHCACCSWLRYHPETDSYTCSLRWKDAPAFAFCYDLGEHPSQSSSNCT